MTIQDMVAILKEIGIPAFVIIWLLWKGSTDTKESRDTNAALVRELNETYKESLTALMNFTTTLTEKFTSTIENHTETLDSLREAIRDCPKRGT